MSGVSLPLPRSFELPYRQRGVERRAVATRAFIREFLELADACDFDARFADLPLLASPEGPLQAAEHIYKGLRRSRWPAEVKEASIVLDGQDPWYVDSHTLIFVSRPSYRLRKRGTKFVRAPAHKGSVFVAYLLPLGDPSRARQIAQEEGLSNTPSALLIGCEWTDADPDDPSKPEDHGSRYDECLT